jgi:hypothetical protein
VGLILFVEGAGKFILLHHVFAQITAFWDSITLAQMRNLGGKFLADSLNATITSFNLGDSGISSLTIVPGITEDLFEIAKNNIHITLTADNDYTGTILDLNNRVQIALYSRLGVTSVGVGGSLGKDIDNISSFFEVVYIYFFVSAGSVVLFLALFKWLGHKGLMDQLIYLSIVTRTLVGVALISLTATLANEDLQSNYTSSSLLLPTILLALTLGMSIHFYEESSNMKYSPCDRADSKSRQGAAYCYKFLDGIRAYFTVAPLFPKCMGWIVNLYTLKYE